MKYLNQQWPHNHQGEPAQQCVCVFFPILELFFSNLGVIVTCPEIWRFSSSESSITGSKQKWGVSPAKPAINAINHLVVCWCWCDSTEVGEFVLLVWAFSRFFFYSDLRNRCRCGCGWCSEGIQGAMIPLESCLVWHQQRKWAWT